MNVVVYQNNYYQHGKLNAKTIIDKIKGKFKKSAPGVEAVTNTVVETEKEYPEDPDFEMNIDNLHISFVVPEPIKGSGGHRNIYRAVKFLRDQGHTITVYYTQTSESSDAVKNKVTDWFYDMHDVEFRKYVGKIRKSDVAIATWWETAYAVNNNLENIRYPFYFVQDFEPSFYPVCSSYILAENTYRLGFSHICSGQWCSDFLEKKYNAEADYFQFPVNTAVYNTSDHKRTKENKNIIFFAKPEMNRRCYEIGVMALEEFSKIRPDVEIILWGSNNVDVNSLPFKATLKGLLPTINDLADMYANADLGIVFSTTNPSLVPYEMLSCGCPVVDLDLDGAVFKYGGEEDRVFLFSPEPKKMAKQIADVIDNKELLTKKAMAGRDWVMKDFPTEDEMGLMICNMILNKIRTGKLYH